MWLVTWIIIITAETHYLPPNCAYIHCLFYMNIQCVNHKWVQLFCNDASLLHMPFQVKCYFTRLFFSWYQKARQKQIVGYCYKGSVFTTILLTFTFHIVEQPNTIGNIIFKLTLIEIGIMKLSFRYKLLRYAFFKWWKKIFN